MFGFNPLAGKSELEMPFYGFEYALAWIVSIPLRGKVNGDGMVPQ